MSVMVVLVKEKELRISREIILHGSVPIEINIMSCSLWSRSFSATYNGMSDVRQHGCDYFNNFSIASEKKITDILCISKTHKNMKK